MFGARNLRAAARRVEVDLAQLLVDLRRRQPLCRQLHRIEDDADFAVDAAIALHPGEPGDRQQFLRHGIVDVPAQLLDGEIGADRGIAGEIVTGGVGAHDLRFENALGQIAADLRDGRAHVLDRAVDRRADRELDDRLRIALGHGRIDLVDALQRSHSGFDALGNLRFQLARRGTGLRDIDDDDRKIDVRLVVHVEAAKADDASDRQHDEQHDRRDRVADRPSRDVPEVHRPTSCSPRRPLPASD
ncbi:hypothetical protein D9M73_113930 [compost metagenome]